MKIAIIGGGAVGLLFASYLQEKHDVILYTRTDSQSVTIRENGLIRVKGDESKLVTLNVRPIHQWEDNGVDLVIICVKQYALEELINSIPFHPNLPLLFIQNGMGHLSLLQTLKTHSIFIGSVEHGVLRVNNHTVNHTGAGITRLAIYRTELTDQWIFDDLFLSSIPAFPFQSEPDYLRMLTMKLVVNAVINPLTAILDVINGKLLTNEYYHLLFKQLFDEVCLALNLEDPTYYEKLVHVCTNTAQNESSMLKDIKHGRKTEIDAILGYVLEEAQKKEIQVPLILAFYHCIKGKELREEGL
jgi:2-dehydropantoate 2-reductase